MGTRPTKTTHAILLVHGIRDQGEWQDQVACVLKRLPGVEVFPIGFGYLNVFAFLFPFIWRGRAIAEVERKFNAAVAECPGAKVSVIAHSFGTYAVVKMLEQRTDVKLHRLVLCGSIVSRSFDWGLLRPRLEHRVLNDYGYEDVWPVMAASVSFTFGPTGTFGCRTPQVIDRPHRFGHGGFFGWKPDGFYDPDFAERYWLSLFRDGQVVEGDRLPSRPWLLSVLPLVKWVVLAVAITMATRAVTTSDFWVKVLGPQTNGPVKRLPPLAGTVSGASDEPLAGVVIRLVPEENNGGTGPQATTDEQGRFRFLDLAADLPKPVTLRAEKDGFRTEEVHPAPWDDSVKIRMTPLPRLGGTVKDKAGRPLEGVELHIKGVGTVLSNEHGHYRFSNLPADLPSSVRLDVSKPGYDPVTTHVSIWNDDNEVRLSPMTSGAKPP